MTRSRIFMTGASGYIGSVVLEQAVQQDYEVYGLSRSKESDEKIQGLGGIPVRGDLQSHQVLREQSSQADIVLHLADAWAGNFGKMEYEEVVRIDAGAVDAMGEGLKGSKKPLVITSGTLVVAADPTGKETDETSPLWDKPLNDRIRCEQHAMGLCSQGITVSAIRLPPWVYGRGGSGVRLFMTLFASMGEVFYVDEGAAHTSVVHVDDAAQLFLLAAQKAQAGDVFNGGSSHAVTTRELATAIAQTADLPLESLPYDEVVSKTGEFMARFLSEENRASGRKAREQMGWEPHGPGILDDILSGSYPAVAQGLKKAMA
ncbi:putative NAD dependent epimerase/dehydratase [Aspergillus clavatus NRRL 1]|uniref:NAD dependent epimerase/dehydratase, putative n=1 Tax=Aspergillus clavatus (strain ATCC 1007 / CBS 513.65 / DSM 816 / NCTC 3887 / NRRL 1 / QM 1276 / 107) TaxID=344612 RepID=A1CUT7_ASPCL|nr:NAD dependent epimerase/dehydratase, putative [Aspergillus clavatus NRRL 1]EAW07074.1 NAD dependent epimerase/dehydratase, putative [Aspergillus clavatus NRRL 1]